MKSFALIAFCVVAGSGCVDLAEPNLPNLGAPAVFNVTVRQIPGLPLEASGTLSAGREASGARRVVTSPFILLGEEFDVGTPTAQGIYIINKQIQLVSPDFTGPFVIQPPAVAGVAAPPLISWYGIRRVGADTVRPDALGDVALRVQSEFGPVQPENRSRQWFLELRGDNGSIRVSGDGPPPETIRIPSQFIPSAPDKQVEISLIYFQSATIVPQPTSYITSVTLDARTDWILKLP